MRITQELVDDTFDKAIVEYTVFFNKCVVAVCQLENSFVLIGYGTCVDPENFNLATGCQVANDQIKSQLWKLLGYNFQATPYQVGACTGVPK